VTQTTAAHECQPKISSIVNNPLDFSAERSETILQCCAKLLYFAKFTWIELSALVAKFLHHRENRKPIGECCPYRDRSFATLGSGASGSGNNSGMSGRTFQTTSHIAVAPFPGTQLLPSGSEKLVKLA
jgi:hypothetical protein